MTGQCIDRRITPRLGLKVALRSGHPDARIPRSGCQLTLAALLGAAARAKRCEGPCRRLPGIEGRSIPYTLTGLASTESREPA